MERNEKLIDNYKGFKIFRDVEPFDCKIIGDNKIVLNETQPYYSVTVRTNKSGFQSVSGFIPENGNLNRIYEQINKVIQRRKNKALELLKIRNESLFYEYECNNVTIRVLRYGDDLDIYVNELKLRNVSLPDYFTFNDVLQQVYFNTIAKYNITKYTNLKTNYYQNKKYFQRNISIMPVYEFLGQYININNLFFFVTDVRSNYTNKSFIFNNEFEVKLNELPNIKIADSKTEINTSDMIQALTKKAQFIE